MGNIDLSQYQEIFNYYDSKEQLTTVGNLTLRYQSHYKSKEFDIYSDILVPENKGSIDKYISRLHKYQGELENLRYKNLKLDDNTVRALREITKFYDIEDDYETGNKRIKSKKFNGERKSIEEIKSIVRTIKERHCYVTEILKSGVSSQSKDISVIKLDCNFPYERKLDFAGRSQYLDPGKEQGSISKFLDNNQMLIISGEGGVGKSTLAMEYGYRVNAEEPKTIVRWFKADSQAVMEASYQSFARELGIDNTGRKIKEVISLSLEKISRYEGMNFLLIFDNAESYKDIESYIKESSSNVKVIITARDAELISNALNNKVGKILLQPFDKKEAQDYLKRKLRLTGEDIKELVEVAGCLPSALSKVAGYLEQKSLTTVRKYIKSYKQLEGSKDRTMVTPALTLLLEELIEQSGKSWKILQYMSYLDCGYIPVALIKAVIEKEDIQKYVSFLIKLALVTVTPDKKGLQMDRSLQDDVKVYMKYRADKSMKIDRVIEQLLNSLDELYPEIGDTADKRWKKAEVYSNQAVLLLKEVKVNYIELSKPAKVSMASICSKLGRYYELITIDYGASRAYYEESLNINKSYSNDYTSSLNDYGRAQWNLSKYEESVSCHKGALKIRKITKGLEAQIRENEVKDESQEINKKPDYVLDLEVRGIANSHHNLGRAYVMHFGDEGKIKEGIKNLKQALNMRIELYKGIAPLVKDFLPEDIITSLRKYKDIKKPEDMTLHPEIAWSLNNLGYTYIMKSNQKSIIKGINYLKAAFKMREEYLYRGINHPELARSLHNMGDSYRRLGKFGENKNKLEHYDKILEFYQRSLDMKEVIYDEHHPEIAKSYNNIGKIQSAKAVKEPIEYYNSLYNLEKSLQIRKILYGSEHIDVAISLKAAAKVYKELGDINKSVDYYIQAYSIYEVCNKEGKLNEKIGKVKKHLSETSLSVEGIIASKRAIIISHGIIDKEWLQVKLQIQEKVLNKVSTLAEQGLWEDKQNQGVKFYLEEEILKNNLGDLFKGTVSINIARMLCFEAINLGIMRASDKMTTRYICASSFLSKYGNLVNPLSEKHPECFVDGSIVKSCIESLPQHAGYIAKHIKYVELSTNNTSNILK